MRYNRVYYILLVLVFICSKSVAQTVTINQPFNDTLLCLGTQFNVPYTVTGSFKQTNIFRVVLSDANGTFTSASPDIGFAYGDQSGSAYCTIPMSTTIGAGYRIRIEADSPTVGSTYISANNGTDIRVSGFPVINNVSSNSPICAGDNIALSTSSNIINAEYNWTGPGNYADTGLTASRNNAPISASGTYIVKVTAYKCSSIDSVSVIVSPPPIKPVATTNSPVCERGDLDLVSYTPTPNVTYSWHNGNGTKISSQPNVIIKNANTNVAGRYIVTVKVGNCEAKDTVYTTVIPSPDTPTISNNTPICEGDTLKLFSDNTTTGVTYRWDGPAGFTSTLKNPIRPNVTLAHAGKYIVYSQKNGCESIGASTTVTIGSSITIPKIIGDSILCPGDTLELTTKGGSGIFKWIRPDSSVFLGGAIYKLNVSVADAGKYYLTVTQSGCTSPPGIINIQIPDLKKPEPTSNTPLCEGDELKLTAIASTGATYSWTGPDGFTSTDQNPTRGSIKLNHAGTYTVVSTLGNCTYKGSTDLIVNKIPLITDIGSNSPICYGGLVQLNTQSDDPTAQYQWTGPNNYSGTDQSPDIPFANAGTGTYTVTATANGCTSAPVSTDIILRDGPETPKPTNNSPIKEGKELLLKAGNNKAGVTYRWEGPDGFTSTDQDPVIDQATILHAGLYTVYATLNGCERFGRTQVIIIGNGKVSVELFPNPNAGKFTIRGIVANDVTQKVAVISLFQRVIYQGEIIPNKKKFEQVIDLGDIPSGVYVLSIGDETIGFSVVRQ